MQIQKKNILSIPDFCPDCNGKLKHVDALDTKAKCYLVYCPVSLCRFCREYKPCPNCGELVCL